MIMNIPYLISSPWVVLIQQPVGMYACSSCQQYKQESNRSQEKYQQLLIDYTVAKNKSTALSYSSTSNYNDSMRLHAQKNKMQADILHLQDLVNSLNRKLPLDKQEYVNRPAQFYDQNRRDISRYDEYDRIIRMKNTEIQQLRSGIKQRQVDIQKLIKEKATLPEIMNRNLIEIDRFRKENEKLMSQIHTLERRIAVLESSNLSLQNQMSLKLEKPLLAYHSPIMYTKEANSSSNTRPSQNMSLSYESQHRQNRLNKSMADCDANYFESIRALNRTMAESDRPINPPIRTKSAQKHTFIKKKIAQLSLQNQILRRTLITKI